MVDQRGFQCKYFIYYFRMAFITGASLIKIKNNNEFYFFNGTNPVLTDNFTFTASQFGGHQYLDYAIIGGGGGGAMGNEVYTIGYGAGGGGSGFVSTSFNVNNTNNQFIYSLSQTPNTPTINLSGVTSIQIQIGNNGQGAIVNNIPNVSGGSGGDTILTVNSGGAPIIITAPGGKGGIGVFDGNHPENPLGGNGGAGFNGGGGGGVSESNISVYLGIGGAATNGINGNNCIENQTSLTLVSGSGGGIGGGNSYTNTYDFGTYGTNQQLNVGGGGGAGSGVTLISAQNTGGSGTGGTVYPNSPPSLPSFPNATNGVDYTGAGGGGGAISYIINGGTFAQYKEGGNGGKGYAILWFHN